jgi:hypothetical protein
MGKVPDARTDWELEAARRRELINSDLETRRLLRGADGTAMNPSIAWTSGGILASLRAALAAPANKAEDAPCPPATAGGMTAVKPGT